MHPPKAKSSNTNVIIFMVILCVVCALILALLSISLQKTQDQAKEIDRSKQMLMAAKIYNPEGYFQIQTPEGYTPAKYVDKGALVPGSKSDLATSDEILAVYQKRIEPRLTNIEGKVKSFQELGIDPTTYLEENKKKGYAHLEWKLFYQVMPNPNAKGQFSETHPEAYIIPINGFGLWDSIYGYIAVASNADTIIGISWYDQKETAGLGAVIADPAWQAQFEGKEIFQESSNGTTNFASAPLGILVVKGTVLQMYGNSPQSHSAVDGIAGATLTGEGVTAAYKDSLTPYRQFLIHMHENNPKP